MPLKESIIQTKVRLHFERQGWLVVKIIQTTLNGWPDLQCHKSGQTIFIETKANGKEPSPLQRYRHDQLMAQGFEVYVIDNIESLKQFNYVQKGR